MNLLSIDHGNEYIKTIHNIFPSFIHAYDSEPPMADEWICYRGRYYCLTKDPSGYKRDKTVDETYLILTMFAIGKERKHLNFEEPLDLAVDLPPLHYGVLKDPFIRYFKENFNGKTSFIYHNKTSVECQVKVRKVQVFPQGYAAMAAYFPDNRSRNKILGGSRDYLLVDIGGYTVDIIPFESDMPIPERSATRELGILRMCNYIKDAVCAKSGRQIAIRDIEKVVWGKKTLLDDENIKLVKQCAAKWAQDIIMASAEKVEDIGMMTVVFVGGGATILKSYLSKAGKQIGSTVFIEDQQANVKGCQILANMS